MNLDHLIYTLQCFFSVFIFCLGWFLGKRSRKTCYLCATGTLLLLFGKLLLLLKPIWETQLFPFTFYIYFQSYWIYPIILFFWGLILPQFSVRWNRLFLFSVALLFFFFSLWQERWRILPPSIYQSMRTANLQNHCRQTTLFTCAPAACVALLSYYQIPAFEGELAGLCGTTSQGTSPFGIYRGLWLKLRKSSFRVCFKEFLFSELLQQSQPMLLPGMGHAVLIVIETDRVILNDPKMLAPVPMTFKQMEEGKYFEGIAIYLEEAGK